MSEEKLVDAAIGGVVDDVIAELMDGFDDVLDVGSLSPVEARRATEVVGLVGTTAIALLATAFREFEHDADMIGTRATEVAVAVAERKLAEVEADGDSDDAAICRKALERLRSGEIDG